MVSSTMFSTICCSSASSCSRMASLLMVSSTISSTICSSSAASAASASLRNLFFFTSCMALARRRMFWMFSAASKERVGLKSISTVPSKLKDQWSDASRAGSRFRSNCASRNSIISSGVSRGGGGGFSNSMRRASLAIIIFAFSSFRARASLARVAWRADKPISFDAACKSCIASTWACLVPACCFCQAWPLDHIVFLPSSSTCLASRCASASLRCASSSLRCCGVILTLEGRGDRFITPSFARCSEHVRASTQ